MTAASRPETGETEAQDREPLTQPSKERLWEVDALRGVAIILMVIYHFTYDLDQFGDFDIGANSGNWQRFANLSASMFVILVGVSLVLSYARAKNQNSDEWPLIEKYLLRGMRIFGYGMLITIVLWFVSPGGSIIFGILHLIGVSIILAYPFLRWPLAAVPVSAGLIILGMIIGYPQVEFPWLIWLGFRPEDIGTMFDYRPLIPWFGVALLGIVIGHWLYRKGTRQFRLPDLSHLAVVRVLSKLGQYSLGIYLIHQPVILVVLDVTGVIDLGIF
ncbi:MAG: heparan-alpha-glucosaminide N-acetyltransferase [Thermomicrobiaceae bacterium]